MSTPCIRVEVQQDPIVTRRINGKNGPVELREQTIYVHNGHHYPTRMRITLDRDQAPYAPGNYALGPRSVVQGQYGEPALGRSIELLSLPAAAVKAA
jgi:hypothetical protein